MTTSSILLLLLPFLLLSHKQTATTTPSKYEAQNRRQSRSAQAIGDLATDTHTHTACRAAGTGFDSLWGANDICRNVEIRRGFEGANAPAACVRTFCTWTLIRNEGSAEGEVIWLVPPRGQFYGFV
uniref:Putative secreted protein n=1 Tax=Anopheles darlingi TaxID=43151 RepID=A0A2M4DET8_ANODA